MKNKIAAIMILLISIFGLCACGDSSQAQLTNEYREVTLTDEENTELLNEILYFIENTGSGKELKMFSDDITVDKQDIVTGIGVKDTKYYVSSSAAYLQIDNYMYRFQLNNSKKVISYIKYKVEA